MVNLDERKCIDVQIQYNIACECESWMQSCLRYDWTWLSANEFGQWSRIFGRWR